MAKYINTNQGLYDVTDPNAPKLLGNMTDYAKTLAEQNFAGYKAGFENPASADAEKNWFIQRESGKVYQDLLKNTTFQEALDPSIGRAPSQSFTGEPVKSGFGGAPIQTADIWANQPATTERPAEQTFNAALAPQVAQPGTTIKSGDPNLYIGATNWATLQKKYTPAQLASLTENIGGKIYWKPNNETTNQSLTPKNLEPNQPLNLPTGSTPANTADAVVASTPAITKDFQDYVNERTLALTENQKKEQSVEDMLASLTGQATQRGADQLAAEETAGIAKMKSDVNNIINQIEAKKLEFESFKQLQQGKPITMSSITGSINQKQSVIASEILLLQAQGMMYQGRLDNAQATVDRAIDLKYQTVDNQYKIYQAQLDALRPTLTREENIRADALDAMMADRQQALADQKAKENALEKAKLGKIDMENQLAQSGYVYVDTPAKRDSLKAQGYDILEQTDNNGVKRTYAKKPDPIKAKSTSTLKGATPEEEMNSQLSTVVGADGFISPENYTLARNAWIKEGLSPTTFDTKFKGFRNPNNPNYVIDKASSNNSNDRTP